MTQTIEQDHAEYNADGWAQNIIEMIDTRAAAMADDGSELGAQDRIERAEQAINDSVLSVMVCNGWRQPGGDNGEAEEYEILLTTGGPAARIYGSLDANGEPETAELQVQDWFRPWTRSKNPITQDTLLEFARCFYFGE
jgi:hypothetical protein